FALVCVYSRVLLNIHLTVYHITYCVCVCVHTCECVCVLSVFILPSLPITLFYFHPSHLSITCSSALSLFHPSHLSFIPLISLISLSSLSSLSSLFHPSFI